MENARPETAADRLRVQARLFWRAWHLAEARQVGLIAAGIAYYALLSAFPAIASVVTIWGALANPAVIDNELENLRQFLPEQAFGLIKGEVDRLVGAHQAFGGWAAFLSLGLTLWSARMGVGSLMRGLNAIHGVPNRSGLRFYAIAIVLTVVLMGVVIVALASIVALPLLLSFFPLGGLAGFAVLLANWVVLLAVVIAAIAVIYRYGPNRTRRMDWFTPGLLLAFLLWTTISLAFTWFAGRFGGFGAVYGSLAAVIALLFWFYLSAYAVLLGAALNSEIERTRRAQAILAERERRNGPGLSTPAQ